MKVTVQSLDQKTNDFIVEETTTLLDFKKMISNARNHPHDQIKLIFSGAILDQDDKKLTDYKICDQSKLVIMLQKNKITKPTPITQTVTSQPTPPVQPVSAPTPVHAVPAQLIPGMSLLQANTSANANAVNPTAQLFNSVLQQSPEMFMQMLMQNPQISQMAQQNPQALMQVISDPNFINNILQVGQETLELLDDNDINSDEQLYEKVFAGMGTINLTEEQKKEVIEIVDLGFGTFEDAVQYYVAYEHNKEMAINALLNDRLDDQ